jgi:hypothetical protein
LRRYCSGYSTALKFPRESALARVQAQTRSVRRARSNEVNLV